MTPRTTLLLALALILLPLAAQAHKASDSYLTLSLADSEVTGRWDIALRDLDHAVGLDGNDDGAITWGELRDRHAAIAAYALTRLDLDADGAPCTLRATDHLVERHSDGGYAVLEFDAECPFTEPVGELRLSYGLLFDLDPQHRGLVQIVRDETAMTAIFSPEASTQNFTLSADSHWRQFRTYVWEGVRHIWIGVDHVLFLLTLLLPAALQRRDGHWMPVAGARTAIGQITVIVTAFTLAHSITLSLAALELVALPARLVEAAIAASVVIAAINNIVPIVTRRLWLVAFGFGLIHGFGFANVLADLGLPADALAIALFEFNLGIELGQLAIVAALLPPLYLLRNARLYTRLALPAGSAVAAFVGMVWLFERALAMP